MFSVHTTPEKTQQSQRAETLECIREHAHSKVLVEPTWLTALLFPPSFKSFRPPFWICVWGRLGQTNHLIIVTSSFSKSSVFKCFPPTLKCKAPFLRAFSQSSVFGRQFLRISLGGRPNQRNKASFSYSSGVVWSGPWYKPTNALSWIPFSYCLQRYSLSIFCCR